MKFQQQEEHCYVPVCHKEDEMNLGVWLSDQGTKQGKLDGSIEKRLEDIGVVWDVLSEQWEDTYQLLVKFNNRKYIVMFYEVTKRTR